MSRFSDWKFGPTLRWFKVGYFVLTPLGRRDSCCFVLERDMPRARMVAKEMLRVSGIASTLDDC